MTKEAKRLSNPEVVALLKEALAAMEIKGENRFGIRAYQNVIASVDNLTTSVYDLWENHRLGEIVGMGPSLTKHLGELFTTGTVKEWESKKKDLPEGMFSLLVVRGIGAKTAFKLANEFEITSRKDALEIVKQAAKDKKIQLLAGFGEKSERDILDSIEDLKKSKQEKQRQLLIHAEEVSTRIVEFLKKHEDVIDAVPLGSLRRRMETVGDIDLAVSSNNPKAVIDYFVTFPEIKDIESQGERMSTVILNTDIQVDVLVSGPDSFGSMLQHFTGSKQHNIKLRQHSLAMGLSLSQYGIKKKGAAKEAYEKFDSEEKFYNRLGLKWIPPELREGRDEIELAQTNSLPKLVQLEDIKGEIHVHTTASDGVNSLVEMVSASKDLGYEYVGIADHAPSVQSRGRFEVNGIMDKRRMEIDQINASSDAEGGIKVLYGYEVNILKDASLGMPDDLLEKLDYVIASVHTSFDMAHDEITSRVISAIENPLVNIIGHPTGRLINQRPAMDLDWEKIFEAIIKNGKILEINSSPSRLDLPATLVHEAVKKGVKLIVNTDAHSISDLLYMKYGIDVARRGGCEKENILNTLSYAEFLKALK